MKRYKLAEMIYLESKRFSQNIECEWVKYSDVEALEKENKELKEGVVEFLSEVKRLFPEVYNNALKNANLGDVK